MWLSFKTTVMHLINKYIPLRIIHQSSNAPWYNNHLKRLSNKKCRLFRSAKRSLSADRWLAYTSTAKAYTSDNVTTWCSRWHMNLDTYKCKFMRISRSKVSFSNYHLNSIPLEAVSCYKYLGVQLQIISHGNDISNTLHEKLTAFRAI